MNRLFATCLALVSLVAVAADEQPGRVIDKPLTKEETRFRGLDKNNDQKLSPEEFQADATSNTEFATFDKDSDGFLSMAEFTSRPIPPAKAPSPAR